VLTKYYRIPTSLSIAVARVAEMMPRACVLPGGTAILTLERQDQDEACYLVLRPTEYLTTCGAWQVRVTPDAMRWAHAGVCVTLGEGMDVAWGDARQNPALGDVRALLPQLKLPDHLWTWRLDARLVAVTPNQVSLVLWTLRMGDVLHSLDERIKALEQMTSAQGSTPSNREIHPHPLRDRRARVRELRLQGKTVKEIAMEIDENEDIVKADLRWLRQKGYLEVLSR